MMMNRRFLAVFLLVAFALPLHADFRQVAAAIEAHHGVKRMSIPFLGLVRFACWIVHPKGVYDFQLATFENLRGADANEFAALMREEVGNGYRPMVQVRSTRSGEFTFIYAKPASDQPRVELFILTHDRHDTVLIHLDADAEVAAQEVAKQRGGVRMAWNR
jgi:hypothetical protein